MTENSSKATRAVWVCVSLLILLSSIFHIASAQLDNADVTPLIGFWTGTFVSRVGIRPSLGEFCHSDKFEQDVEFRVSSVGNRFDLLLSNTAAQQFSLRQSYQITGSIVSWDASTGLATVLIDSQTSDRCVLLRITGANADRMLTFVQSRDPQACTSLPALSNLSAQCSANETGAALPAIVLSSSIVELATLKPTCELSEWSPWGSCSKECGTGVLLRTRTAIANSSDVQCNLDLVESKLCATQPCSSFTCTENDYTQWSSWSTCSVSCGYGGKQYRTRAPAGFSQYNPECYIAAKSGDLPPTHEVKSCATPCDSDAACVVSAWSAYSVCSQRCANDTSSMGSRTRSRVILTQPGVNGAPCPPLTETSVCGNLPCQPNCVGCGMSTLTKGSQNWCTCCKWAAQCGSISVFDDAGCQSDGFCSTLCLADDTCDNEGTPLDCVVSAWASFGVCVGGTCDASGNADTNGTRTRNRLITRGSFNGGRACPVLAETESCAPSCTSTPSPEADPCRSSPWSSWSSCSCGQQRTRSRYVAPPAGKSGCSSSESEPCPTIECPVDCTYSSWAEWSSCARECGGSQQSRARQMDQPAKNGGSLCSVLSQDRSCNSIACDQNCRLSEFGPFSECSAPCGGGTRSRSRSILVAPIGPTAQPCASLEETTACNTDACTTSVLSTDAPAQSTHDVTAAPTAVETMVDRGDLVSPGALSTTSMIIIIVVVIVAVCLIVAVVVGVLHARKQKQGDVVFVD